MNNNNNISFDDLTKNNQQRVKGFAIASLMCGIASIVSCFSPILAILAIVFFAIDKAKFKTPNNLAITGLVLGIISLAVLLLVIIGLIIIRSNPELSSAFDSIYDYALQTYDD